mgnify:FL=1
MSCDRPVGATATTSTLANRYANGTYPTTAVYWASRGLRTTYMVSEVCYGHVGMGWEG